MKELTLLCAFDEGDSLTVRRAKLKNVRGRPIKPGAWITATQPPRRGALILLSRASVKRLRNHLNRILRAKK